ncbi:MAG TPA: hypothetical protein VLZ54_11525, partial [Arenibacter sp.]|nr:hypothetical protein [Arenibacter sp.]
RRFGEHKIQNRLQIDREIDTPVCSRIFPFYMENKEGTSIKSRLPGAEKSVTARPAWAFEFVAHKTTPDQRTYHFISVIISPRKRLLWP